MPDTFFVAEHIQTGEYVSGINSQGMPVFDANRDNAEWSADENIVAAFINRFNISDAKVTGQGGNHPPKPPLSA